MPVIPNGGGGNTPDAAQQALNTTNPEQDANQAETNEQQQAESPDAQPTPQEPQ